MRELRFHREVYEGGAIDEAVKLWEEVIEKHSQHREAPRAAYYIGIAYEQQKSYAAARIAFAVLRVRHCKRSRKSCGSECTGLLAKRPAGYDALCKAG